MTPLERYQHDLLRTDFIHDASQAQAVAYLQKLYDELTRDPDIEKKSLLQRMRLPWAKPAAVTPVKGLYFWGGVGRGKTYLMDTFYDSLPFENKMRVHFHRFMQRVHKELRQLEGVKNPLVHIGKLFATEAKIICFDEFFVTDITDAMILAGVLEQLFAHGVTLVATSNIEPDGLYKDGLQRSRFLPAIAQLKQHTQVFNLDGGIDYRLRILEQAELYHFPLDTLADISLNKTFESLAPDLHAAIDHEPIEINARMIMTRRLCEDLVWFDFKDLCEGARSQNDYLEIAKMYHEVIVSNVPQLGRANDDAARRFINLVDVFYDNGVKLIISAAYPIHALYSQGRLSFEFERTQSRLIEMQSHEYLASVRKI